MIRNIIWDVDGTLFDTYPAINGSIRKAVNQLGADVPLKQIETLTRISLGHCISELAVRYQLEEKAIEGVFEHFYAEVTAAECPPFPGVMKICSYLCSLGGKNIIITHRGKSGTEELLSAFGLGEMFADLITRDDGYARKPDPAAFFAAVERNNLKKEETINIGDREIDIQAGQAAGIFSVLYAGSPVNVKPDLIVEYYEDLYRFIQEQNKKEY
ncbi:MAG: HAD family hydrolase [Anaerolineales bacterium]|nr:HAD family hydrolase [Anaerolineales bacterium]